MIVRIVVVVAVVLEAFCLCPERMLISFISQDIRTNFSSVII